MAGRGSLPRAATGAPPPGTPGDPALGGALGGPALARLLLTALLIAAVLVGLRGGFTLHGWRGPYRRDAVAVGAGLEVALAALLVALLVRGRQPSNDFRVVRLRGVLRVRAARGAGGHPGGPAAGRAAASSCAAPAASADPGAADRVAPGDPGPAPGALVPGARSLTSSTRC